jgi:hypothetical protein
VHLYRTDMNLGFLGMLSIDLPSGKHLVFGCDAGEGVVVENDSDPGLLQPFQTSLLQTCKRSVVLGEICRRTRRRIPPLG